MYLYSSDKNQKLGCLNCTEFSAESICNEFGTYGSEFNSESIWNEFSTEGPKIYDSEGNYYGRFSINIYSGFQNSEELKNLYDISEGNLEKVRMYFCD